MLYKSDAYNLAGNHTKISFWITYDYRHLKFIHLRN